MRGVNLVALLLASCVHDERSNAKHYMISGTAYWSCRDQPAVGKPVRLTDAAGRVIANDISGTDGSFTLMPREEREVELPLYLSAGGQRAKLGQSQYASWVETGVWRGASLSVPCETGLAGPETVEAIDAGPAAAPASEVRVPARAPSKKLLPTGYLGGP